MQHVNGISPAARPPQRQPEQAPHFDIARQRAQHRAKLRNRAVICAGLHHLHRAQQRRPRYAVEPVVRAVENRPRQIPFPRSRRQHRLQVQRLCIIFRQPQQLARHRQHLDRTPRIAQRRCLFKRRVAMIGLDRQQPVVPRQRGKQAITVAHHVSRIKQRIAILRVKRQRRLERPRRAVDIAFGQEEARFDDAILRRTGFGWRRCGNCK